MRTIKFTITEKDDGRAIRDFLRAFGVSSSLLTRLKRSETGILLNGKFARSIDKISAGDILEISIENRGEMPEKYENSGAAVTYEDEDIIVFDKPPYMPVHESRNHRGDTLANAAACHMRVDTAFRSVYRLDRNTSGLVLIAKNELAAAKLAGRINKDYYGVCSGILTGEGNIDLPIRRVADSIITRGVFPDGERAVTHWKAVQNFKNKTLLRLNLETGRTHQIRVHLSHIGHPLLGDTLYGGDCREINRQALHCKKISFVHPITGESTAIESDFPDDIKTILKD